MIKQYRLFFVAIFGLMALPTLSMAQTCQVPVGANTTDYQICDLGVPKGHDGAQAIDVTPNGRTIVGAVYVDQTPTAMMWSADTGFVILPSLPSSEGEFPQEHGAYGRAHGVSGDARVVGGLSNLRAVVWAAGQDVQNIGQLQPESYVTEVDDVSADGLLTVGSTIYELSADFTSDAFVWSQEGGFQILGRFPGHTRADARGISADGAYVVGVSQNPDTNSRAFRWTEVAGLEDIVGSDSAANAVSADGSVVVGWYRIAGELPSSQRAFRWTQEGGVEQLGHLLGNDHPKSEALAISDDGSIVAGVANTEGPMAGFVWTEETGMQNLGSLPGGGAVHISAMSADGSVIVGRVGDILAPYEWRAVYWVRSGEAE